MTKPFVALAALTAVMTLAGCASNAPQDVGGADVERAATSSETSDAEAAVRRVADGVAADGDGIVDATDPDAILAIARGFGSARLTTDNLGDPLIEGRIDGVRYVLFFFGCDDGAACRDVLFRAGWTGSVSTLESVNAFNAETRFGKAYIDDEGDAILEMVVNLHGGVTQSNLDDSFDWWTVAVRTFLEHQERWGPAGLST